MCALSGGKLTPDMVKTVSGMFSRMSPEELQNMMKMCSTLPRQNQASSSTFNDTRNRHSVMGSSQSVSVDNGLFEENHNRVGESSMNWVLYTSRDIFCWKYCTCRRNFRWKGGYWNAKITENYALFFLFWVTEIECRSRADGEEF